MQLCLEVASITVSSMGSKMWSNCRKSSDAQLFLTIHISLFVNKLNKKDDVGEPCLKPITLVIIAVPKMLYVDLCTDNSAKSIEHPHLSPFNVYTKLSLGILSYTYLAVSSLNLPLSYSSITSRELLSQFLTVDECDLM